MSDGITGTSLLRAVTALKSGELSDSRADLAKETVIDTGVLGLIPGIGPVIEAAKNATLAVRDALFFNKVARFFSELDPVTDKERQQFRKKMDGDQEFADQVGTQIILLLDRFENMIKPGWLAKIFGAYIKGIIDLEQFSRLGAGLDITSIYDINELLSSQSPSQGLLARLAPSGLASFDIGRTRLTQGQINYSLTRTGEDMKNILSP